jgi:predicted transcriptional regulator
MMARPTLLVYTGGEPDCARQVCSQAQKQGWLPIVPETEMERRMEKETENQAASEREMLTRMVSLLSRVDALLLPSRCTEPERTSIATALDMEAGYRVVPVFRYQTGEQLPPAPDEPKHHPTARETLVQAMHLNGRKRELLLEIIRRGGSNKDELMQTTGIPVSTIRASLRGLEREHLIFRAAYGSTPGTIQRRIFLTCRGEDVADLLPMAGVLRGMGL